MAVIGTLNGYVYQDADFDSANYALRFQQLIGDIYDHISAKFAATGVGSLSIGTGSKSLTITSNLSSANIGFSPGQWVYLRPAGVSANEPNYIRNFMLGIVTAATSSGITVNSIIAHGSGSFGTYYIGYVGDIIQTLVSPMAVVNGGTGSTVADGIIARNAIGVGDPATRADTLFEDFTGHFLPDGTGYGWLGEKLQVNTLANPDAAYSSSGNPISGGLFLPDAQVLYKGDSEVYNYNPYIPLSDNGVNATIIAQSDWSSRPGVIGMSVQNSGARVSLMSLGLQSTNYFGFPYTGDSFEFSFMFPTGEGFSAANPGGFSIGFTFGNLQGYNIFFNVGNIGASGIDSLISVDGSSVAGSYNAASILTWNVGVDTGQLWSDNVSQLTALNIQEGRWYKVRITKDTCAVYSNGLILYKTIAGWTSPAPSVSKANRFFCSVVKTGGDRKATVLLDYVYHRHAVSR